MTTKQNFVMGCFYMLILASLLFLVLLAVILVIGWVGSRINDVMDQAVVYLMEHADHSYNEAGILVGTIFIAALFCFVVFPLLAIWYIGKNDHIQKKDSNDEDGTITIQH